MPESILAESRLAPNTAYQPNGRPTRDEWVDRVADDVSEVLAAERLELELVVFYDPITHVALHLNPIETHFRVLRKRALDGSDYRSWRELGWKVQKVMHELNRERFVPSAKVRRCLWSRH